MHTLRLVASLALLLFAGCSSPKVTVVVPEWDLWDSVPTKKDAARAGTATRGQVLAGACGGYCQFTLPTGTVFAYNGGTAPFPIAGQERTLLAAAEMHLAYDANGTPTGAIARAFAAGDKVPVATDLPGVPATLACVIEKGTVAGYVPRGAVEPGR